MRNLADQGEASAVAEDERLFANDEHVEAAAANLGFELFHGGEEIDPADIAANEPAVASLAGLKNALNKWIIQFITLLLISVHLISFSVVGFMGAENGLRESQSYFYITTKLASSQAWLTAFADQRRCRGCLHGPLGAPPGAFAPVSA